MYRHEIRPTSSQHHLFWRQMLARPPKYVCWRNIYKNPFAHAYLTPRVDCNIKATTTTIHYNEIFHSKKKTIRKHINTNTRARAQSAIARVIWPLSFPIRRIDGALRPATATTTTSKKKGYGLCKTDCKRYMDGKTDDRNIFGIFAIRVSTFVPACLTLLVI